MPSQRLFAHRRRGWTTLWLVIWLPVLMALLCGLLAVANLWLARVELENALESAALAAVKEWGDQGGGDTAIPRDVGVNFAAANCVRGFHLPILTNYAGPNAPCNQNLSCDIEDGHLIFGAIDDSDPNHVIFNAGVCPSCAAGRVLVDASAQGAGNLRQDNGWGVAFLGDATTPANLRIVRIVIDLQANGGIGQFQLDGLDSADGPTITNNVAPHAVSLSCPGNMDFEQPDLEGFTDPAAQIIFSPVTGLSPTLEITFLPDNNPIGGTDDGFAPCDRFRFGARTINVGAGTNTGNDDDDGDGIGVDRAVVTVFFELGGVPLPPVTETFFDNDEPSNPKFCPPQIEPICGDLIVHPALIPNLPPPPSSGNNNNGQSYALTRGGGPGKFGVRAQRIFQIPTLGNIFLGNVGNSCVQAKTTAEYDCTTRRVRLVRIDEFICPGP
jgi:hypothetical protein